nr:MAG TPA: hypothetical protein [Caudoviricetes sp.]
MSTGQRDTAHALQGEPLVKKGNTTWLSTSKATPKDCSTSKRHSSTSAA